MIELFVEIGLIALIIVAANLITRSGEAGYRRAFDWTLLALSVPLFAAGVFFVFVSDEQLAALRVAPGVPAFPLITNSLAMGVILEVMAVWGFAFSFRSTRTGLSRYLAIDPDSSVHTLALVASGWLAGGVLLQFTQTDLDQVAAALGTITVPAVALEQLLFVVIAALGVGLAVRRTPAQVISRLGLEPVTMRQLLEGSGWILLLLIIQSLAGALWYVIDPDQAALVEEINLQLQGDLDSVWEWFVLALAAGIGEEILFRGALQPVLGIWLTSILFAIVHIQYGFFTPATLALFVIALALGIIRRRHNTTLAIYVHVGYDLVLGLSTLALLQ